MGALPPTLLVGGARAPGSYAYVKGNKYIVTLVDYFSRWPEAAGLPDKTAQGVAMFLYELFCRFVGIRSRSLE